MYAVNLGRDAPTASGGEGTCLKLPAPVLNELWEELLTQDGTCWGTVVSNSMYPLVKRGDQVLVEKALSDKVRFGDIVVFRRNEKLTTHRVLGKRDFSGESHFLEKGDASLQSSFVPTRNIIGRVTVIRSSTKTVPTIRGSGRLLQLTLACISYTSLQMWAMLEYCLTCGRRVTYKHRYNAAYDRFFSLLRRITLRLFLQKMGNCLQRE